MKEGDTNLTPARPPPALASVGQKSVANGWRCNRGDMRDKVLQLVVGGAVNQPLVKLPWVNRVHQSDSALWHAWFVQNVD